jgi:hypothetical protein
MISVNTPLSFSKQSRNISVLAAYTILKSSYISVKLS